MVTLSSQHLSSKAPGLVEHPPHCSRAQTGQVGQVQATPLLFRASGPGDVGVGGEKPFHAKALSGTVPVTVSQRRSAPSGDR